MFADESIWKYEGQDAFTVVDIKQEKISAEYQTDLTNLCIEVTAHKYTFSKYPYYPAFYTSYWLCACGQFNMGLKCLRCDEDKNIIEKNITRDVLVEKYNQRMIIEEEERKERKALAEEELRQWEEKERLRREQEENERLAREEARRQKIEHLQNGAREFVDMVSKKRACLNCGSVAGKGNMFCTKCGNKL